MAQVMVAMSGGVDSSMAAALLVESGHDVTGVHLKMADTPSGLPGKGCCTLDDARDARRVADLLGIDFYVWDFAETFAEQVVEDFVDAYAAGMTPNPCIRCNERVKYTALMARAVAAGFDHLATGHHVRLQTATDGAVSLHRPVDDGKDQTYVLYMASQLQLQRSMFPVGVHHKAELREMAASRGLITASKPDSHDICFIPSGDTAGFLETRLGRRPGPIVDADGARVGTHDGAYRYTVGQRRGLGIGGLDTPRFVTGIEGDTVTIGRRADLEISRLRATDLAWTTDDGVAGLPADGLTAQVRYHGTAHPVTWAPVGDGVADGGAVGGGAAAGGAVGGGAVEGGAVEGGQAIEITFDGPGRPAGVAPGQAVVLYDGDRCLGGGTIAATAA